MHQVRDGTFPKISARQRTGRLARGDVPSHSSNVRRLIIHHVSTMCTLYVHRCEPLKIYCTVVILKETQDSLVLKRALLASELLFPPVFHHIV